MYPSAQASLSSWALWVFSMGDSPQRMCPGVSGEGAARLGTSHRRRAGPPPITQMDCARVEPDGRSCRSHQSALASCHAGYQLDGVKHRQKPATCPCERPHISTFRRRISEPAGTSGRAGELCTVETRTTTSGTARCSNALRFLRAQIKDPSRGLRHPPITLRQGRRHLDAECTDGSRPLIRKLTRKSIRPQPQPAADVRPCAVLWPTFAHRARLTRRFNDADFPLSIPLARYRFRVPVRSLAAAPWLETRPSTPLAATP